jgi:hypothetical protein
VVFPLFTIAREYDRMHFARAHSSVVSSSRLIRRCAHALLHTMPTEVGGTEVNVSKAGSYLDGKLEGDNSMTCKSLVGRSTTAGLPGSYAVYG